MKEITQIVKPKRLRAEAGYFRRSGHSYMAELLEECAEEIQRLRDALRATRKEAA